MKNFIAALLDLVNTLGDMYLDTVSDVPDALGMDAWQTFEMNGRTYQMHMEVSWREI